MSHLSLVVEQLPRKEKVEGSTPSGGSKLLSVPRVGEVLKAPNGVLRIVRAVHGSSKYTRVYVYFVIRHCSWTGRPYTVYLLSELARMGYTSTHVVVKLDKLPKSKEIENAINNHFDRSLTCCKVHGII